MPHGANSNDAGRLGVSYQLIAPLPAAQAELPLIVRVLVRNTGAAPWSHWGTHPVNLSYHWLDQHGQVVDFEGVRAAMPAPLRPGEAVELELLVEPPPRAGNFQLQLDMVEEGVAWFSLQGVPALTIPVRVDPAPADALRVCIINGNCVPNDALGNHVLNQIRFFRERGYQPLALLEHLDPRQPIEVRPYLARVSLDELREGPHNPQTRRAVHHFHSADLYVFNYSTYYSLIEAIRLVSHGVVIFDYHGVTPPHLWEGPGRETLIEGQRNLELVRYADYAIAHSAFTRNELIQTGAIVPERVYQLPYVVPLERFRPGKPRADLLQRYGLLPDQPLLIYVGRMAINKRVDDLVRALALIRAQHPGTALLVVGDDKTPAYAMVVARVKQLAEQLGVSDGLIFTGQIPDDELVAHYQLADVFVTASIHEGFCIPVLEAMACGVPAVGAHATALPETIGAGGLTFRPEDPADLAEKVVAILSSRQTHTHQDDGVPQNR